MASNPEEIVTALYDYAAKDPDELSIQKNDQLTVLDKSGAWFTVRNRQNKVGLVPSNYVKLEKSKGKLVNRIANKFPGKKTKHPSNSTTGNTRSELPGNPLAENTGAMSDSYLVKFPYDATRPDELSLVKGMQICVIEKEDDGWWQGKNKDGTIGWFPSNYVEPLSNQVVPASLQANSCLQVVEAIYPFVTNSPEELQFEQGERLDIIAKPPADPEWYMARNAAGQTGLIPRTYVEPVANAPSVFQPELRSYDDVSNDQTHPNGVQSTQGAGDNVMSGKPWYVGDMTRQVAENTLRSLARNAEFIIRNSESTIGDYSVSMKAPDKIKHFKVSLKEGKYCIGQRKFDSLEQLIEHYRKAPIYTSPSGDKMFLGQPMSR